MILKPKNREEWLAMRLEVGIGGSEAGCVLGLNPWKSNIDLYREKIGEIEPEDISDKPAVKFGKEAERHIRALFRLDYPSFEVEYAEFDMYVNDSLPWQFATLDGALTDTETGQRGILEIKTCTIQNKSQWDEWENGIPQRYYAQVLHQLSATGLDFAILRAYIRHYRGGEFRATVRDYRIDRKDVQEDIEYLCEKEAAFMECVKNRKPPAAIITM